MKNFVLAVILTAALIGLFSYIDYRKPMEPTGNGSGTKHKGASGLILPGDGESLADTIIEPESIPELPEDKQKVGAEVTEETKIRIEKVVENYTKIIQEKARMEERNKVDITAFWHGVSAVLIGEASALLVAFAWMKIRGGK